MTTDSHPVPLLEVRRLSASYEEAGTVLPVLEDASFAVAEGEFVAMVGPSGSGKSTMLDIIAGLLEPDHGAIAMDGVESSAAARLGRSAYMKQRDLLLPWRSAVANAALALEVHGIRRQEARRIAAERFPEFGLAGFEDRYPAQLSGGMRQRVAFVRTMLGGQPLVLLDEPFGSLDALTRAASQDWLAAAFARDARTVVLVTHDVDEAMLLADRVLVLSERPGRIVHQERIELPRPRSRDSLGKPELVRLKMMLLEQLGIVHHGAVR